MKAVVTTKFRGVFFGEVVEDKSPDSITLHGARNCIYWSAKTGGFMGLASIGPQEGSKIGTKTEAITLYGITSIAPCSDEAVKVWESFK